MKRHDNTPSDQRLWENIRNGNMDVLRIVYNKFFEALYQYRLKTTTDRVTVEDAIQFRFAPPSPRLRRISK